MKRFNLWSYMTIVLGKLSFSATIYFGVFVHLIMFGVVFHYLTPENYMPLSGDTYYSTSMEGAAALAKTFIASGQLAFEPNGVPVGFRMPMHYFLMGITSAWNVKYWWLLWAIASSCLFGLILVCITRIGCRFEIPHSALNLLLLIYILHPAVLSQMRNMGWWLSGTLFSLLVVLSILRYFEKPCMARTCTLGLVLGLGCLVHGSFLLLPIAVALVVIFGSSGKISLRFFHSVIVFFVADLVLSPWTIRNYHAFGKFIPSSTGAGLQFWGAQNEYFSVDGLGKTTFALADKIIQQRMNKSLPLVQAGILDMEVDRELSESAKQLLLSEPTLFFRRFYIGFFSFWAPKLTSLPKLLIAMIINYPFVILMLVLFSAAIANRTLTRPIFSCASVLFYFWMLFAAVQAIASYYVTQLPLLFLLVGGLAVAQHKFLESIPAKTSSD
ncbi:MAG: hypothetical protein WCO03_02260, partial [bacterium]